MYILGFQFDSDLSMLAKTWRFAAADLLSPKNVMDTKRFIDLVSLVRLCLQSAPVLTFSKFAYFHVTWEKISR